MEVYKKCPLGCPLICSYMSSLFISCLRSCDRKWICGSRTCQCGRVLPVNFVSWDQSIVPITPDHPLCYNNFLFAYNMLLVRWSEGNWQVTKSPLQELDMWHMWKSISCFEEDYICVQNWSINSNPDYLRYCTLYCTVATVHLYSLHIVYTSWLYIMGTRQVASFLMVFEGATPPTKGMRRLTNYLF